MRIVPKPAHQKKSFDIRKEKASEWKSFYRIADFVGFASKFWDTTSLINSSLESIDI